MVESHIQSFFGQSTGFILQSSSKNEPFLFLRCIKKNPDGSWEKPSLKQGKTIKCNFEEMIMILQVLNKKIKSWSSYHNFNDNKTQISFQWENENYEKLWINIGSYSKMLNFAQVEIFRMLLEHILQEKIEYATTFTLSKENTDNEVKQYGEQKDNKEKMINESSTTMIEEVIDNDTYNAAKVEGSLESETEKAILIKFNNGKEVWIPKSTIQSEFTPEKNKIQSFLIDKWILNRNNIIST